MLTFRSASIFPANAKPSRPLRPDNPTASTGEQAQGGALMPLLPGQAPLRLAFLPIRPRVRADDATGGARHARAEGGHRHGIAEAVDVHHGIMVAQLADDPQ